MHPVPASEGHPVSLASYLRSRTPGPPPFSSMSSTPMAAPLHCFCWIKLASFCQISKGPGPPQMNPERVSSTRPPLIAGLRRDRGTTFVANPGPLLGLVRPLGALYRESSNPSESNPWRPVGMGASLKDEPFVFAASNWVRSAKMSAVLSDRSRT
jgi:hypothetical protein